MPKILLNTTPFLLVALFLLMSYLKNKNLSVLLTGQGLNLLGWYLNMVRALEWPFINPTDIITKIYNPVAEVINYLFQ